MKDAKSRVAEVDVTGYKQLRSEDEAHTLVEIKREESEWAAGHTAGAVD